MAKTKLGDAVFLIVRMKMKNSNNWRVILSVATELAMINKELVTKSLSVTAWLK